MKGLLVLRLRLGSLSRSVTASGHAREDEAKDECVHRNARALKGRS
jgi:hypothetical protein